MQQLRCVLWLNRISVYGKRIGTAGSNSSKVTKSFSGHRKKIEAQTFCLRLVSFSGVSACVLSAVAGCGKFKSQSLDIPDDLTLTGFVNLSGAATTPDKIKISIINSQGLREDSERFSLDTQTGAFSLLVKREQLISGLKGTEPERWAAAGLPTSINTQNDEAKAAFGARTVGVVRLEITQKDAQEWNGLTAPNLAYNQVLVPFSRSNQLSTQQSLSLATAPENGLRLTQVGRVKVLVQNKDGSAVANAYVSALPVGNYLESSTSVIPIPLWKNPLYKPVAARTTTSGSAVLFPLPATGAEPKFQIVATAAGHCGFVTSPVQYTPETPQTLTITLEECSQNVLEASGVQWNAQFGDGVLRSQLPLENGSKAEFALTNKSYLPLKIAAKSMELRGFLIRIYEGDSAQGEVKLEKQILTFASDPVVDIPVAYNSGTSENGRFTMVVSSVFTEADRKTYGDPPSQTLHGVRNTSKPVLDKALLSLASSVGTANVMSGLSGTTVTLRYDRCADGYSLAARLGLASSDVTKLKFVACSNKQAVVPVESIVSSNVSALGGTDTVRFFMKDNFGNISDDSKDDLNALQIYLDFGKPNLATQDIGFLSRIGFVTAGTTSGTQAAPTLFGKSADGSTNETLQISQSPSNALVLRFNYPENCKHDSPSTADGISGTTGQKIAKFAMAKTSESAAALADAQFTVCGSDQAVSSSDFDFPSDAAQPASFYLRVIDAAGNASQPQKYTIPACSTVTLNDGNTKVCWKN